MPFRSIVTEQSTWQQQLSQFLLKNALIVDDPYIVKYSKELTTSLDSCKSAFLLDVENLFYSVSLDALLPAVHCCIKENGDVAFQNSSSISVVNFMVLL